MQPPRITVRRLAHFPAEWELPGYATPGSAAVDLRNAGPPLSLRSLERALVPTGLAVALPPGWEAQIRPRSGISYRRGITIVNAPATIDSDYRGELLIPLINLDRALQEVEHGERVAQLLIAPVFPIRWESVEELPESARGGAGFGSTGR